MNVVHPVTALYLGPIWLVVYARLVRRPASVSQRVVSVWKVGESAGHWFSVQIGMVCGYATAWPASEWLIRSGRKERMEPMGDDASAPAATAASWTVPRHPQNGASPVHVENAPLAPRVAADRSSFGSVRTDSQNPSIACFALQ
ncbi:MAG TPA: DUF4396 domain-containing protein [Gaiellaceae bacterium]